MNPDWSKYSSKTWFRVSFESRMISPTKIGLIANDEKTKDDPFAKSLEPLNTMLALICLLSIATGASAQAPVSAGKELPDIASLLSKVRDNQDVLDKMKENYTYTQTVTERQLDKHGKQTKQQTRTYDVSFYRHREVARLTAIDGNALSSAGQIKEQRRVEKLIKELEDGRVPPDPEANRRMNISTLLRAEHFHNSRRGIFRSRAVIMFDFEPNPDFKPVSGYESFYKNMASTMSVDEGDLQVARVEFKLIGAFKIGGGAYFEMKPGAWFVREQDRFFGEIWLPSSAEVKFDARALMFYGFGIDEATSFSSYHRFDVNTEEKVAMPGNTNDRDRQ